MRIVNNVYLYPHRMEWFIHTYNTRLTHGQFSHFCTLPANRTGSDDQCGVNGEAGCSVL